MATVRLEGSGQLKNPMTSSGLEPATFRLVAQCLSQLRYRYSRPNNVRRTIWTDSRPTPKKLNYVTWQVEDTQIMWLYLNAQQSYPCAVTLLVFRKHQLRLQPGFKSWGSLVLQHVHTEFLASANARMEVSGAPPAKSGQSMSHRLPHGCAL
jgi:hypothetical protein